MRKFAARIILLFLGVAAIAGLLLFSKPGTGAQHDLETTRRELRQQGFKIELTEFDLSTPPEVSRRAALLATTTWAGVTNPASRPRPYLTEAPPLILMQPTGPDAAVVIWQLPRLQNQLGADAWPQLRLSLATNAARLDAALAAAISGPIRFEPIGSSKPNPLLPYLADLKNLTVAFSARTLLALHDGDNAAAWTNLLGTTCLVTAYEPEPIEISQLVRFSCADVAWNCLWNALQSRDWSDTRLAELQRRWEAMQLWKDLPEAAAYSRASAAASCELERRDSISLFATLKDCFQSPASAWAALVNYRQRLHYLTQGSYEDEKALLLYYHDRELELRRAVACQNWVEMRGLVSVTNSVPFTSKYSSRSVALMNMRSIAMRFQSRGQGPLARAAEVEARRRLIVTALALERYRARHNSYPQDLQQLVPDLLATVPIDFMDGQPLRYRPTGDGHFVLYSVGLDCIDNGGHQLARGRRLGPEAEDSLSFGFPQGSDLVWPRPASAGEVEVLQQTQLLFQAQQRDRSEEMQAAAQWNYARRRQSEAASLLARSSPEPKDRLYRGRPLTEILRNPQTVGTNRITSAELLSLKPVQTGAEPEVVTFELPINFDVLTNLGGLQLYVDPVGLQDSDFGAGAEQFECRRAANGSCLLVWSTIYEAPGKHALQVGLSLEDSEKPEDDLLGPLIPYVVSNLCQFSVSSTYFEPAFGPTLRARLAEPKGEYILEIKSPAGATIKTISGSTSNSTIKVHWDLKDEGGHACTNQSFDTIWHIRLASGRAQTLRGP